MTHYDTILVVDFGSQVTRLIARRVREAGVYSEIVPHQKAWEAFLRIKPKGLIFSGGPCSVTQAGSPRVSQNFFSIGIPILGICYGGQILCQQLGGKVANADIREFGRALLKIERKSPLFADIWEKDKTYEVWMSHGDYIIILPQGFQVIASSPGAPFAVVADEKRQFYAVQFHPEVSNTLDGNIILYNFVRKIVKISGDWTMFAYRKKAITDIRNQVGTKKVLCGLSGGVDSTVAAVLLHEAIGDQLICILIDHGLMRKNEASDVISLFRKTWSIPLIHVNAENIFLEALATISDPEQKRKIIGKIFIEIFEKEAEKAGGADFLAQGTLYPDIIESISFAGGPSVTIKSHHNVGGLPAQMKMRLVEPLRELFKDEVRILGQELGLPRQFIDRHPFPGPGLAVRCPGIVNREKLALLREADALYIEEIHKAGLYDAIWQAFAILLPIKTVGVMGDARTYEYVCVLRAVTSVDGMTADFYHYDMSFLGKVATRIVNEIPGINRVVYDITSKPPGTIEWE